MSTSPRVKHPSSSLLEGATRLLPPLSSFTTANVIALVRILLEPAFFLVTLPFLLFIGFFRYYIFGGREENRRLAARLPDIVSERLQRMSKDAMLPAAHSAVSTTTRSAPTKGPQPFQSSFVDSGDATLHLVTGGDYSCSKPSVTAERTHSAQLSELVALSSRTRIQSCGFFLIALFVTFALLRCICWILFFSFFIYLFFSFCLFFFFFVYFIPHW